MLDKLNNNTFWIIAIAVGLFANLWAIFNGGGALNWAAVVILTLGLLLRLFLLSRPENIHVTITVKEKD